MAEFKLSKQDSVTILEVSGRIDPDNWRGLNEALEKATTPPSGVSLLIDLFGLEYMASAGFRELFMVGRKLGREGGKMAVCGLKGEVKRVFELAGFATAYPVFDDKSAAVAHLSA